MKNVKVLFLAIAMIGFISSCQDQNEELSASDKLIELSEIESSAIINSTEFQNFISIKNQFIEVVNQTVSNGYDLEELKQLSIESVNSNESDELFTALFGSKEKGLDYLIALENARTQLLNAYPVINKIRDQYAQPSLNSVSVFYETLDVINKNRNEMNLSVASVAGRDAEPVCGSYWNQVKLGVCATGCSFTTGGLGTVFCGWLCWCTFCSQNSELSNAICETDVL